MLLSRTRRPGLLAAIVQYVLHLDELFDGQAGQLAARWWCRQCQLEITFVSGFVFG
jgi:hypothetical protein